MYNGYLDRSTFPSSGDGSGANTPVDSSTSGHLSGQHSPVVMDPLDYQEYLHPLYGFPEQTSQLDPSVWTAPFSSLDEHPSRGPLGSPFNLQITDFSYNQDIEYSPIYSIQCAQHNTYREPSNIPIIRVNTVVPPHTGQPSPLEIHPSPASTSSSSFQPTSPAMMPLYSNSPVSPLFSPGAQTYHSNVRTVWEIEERYSSPGRYGPRVPQKSYRPHTLSDRKRYVEEVDLEEPIMFFMQHPDECGIPLKDALTGKYMRLVGRDDSMFVQRGPSVSIRLKWPGYGNWSRQIPTKDFRSPPGPITRAKLAKNIARTVERFIKEKQKLHLDPDEDSTWRVGPGHIGVDDLVLVGLQHVSKGSWQAQLRLSRPRSGH